jgi:nitrite reductase/ring-hydroxylating ferredoxin subunit/uncharacterized membrane protein
MAVTNSSGAAAPHLGINVDRMLRAIPGLEEAALSVSGAIHNAVLSGGSATRAAADALHGTWIGHPLHPLLVTIPLGAWSLAGLYDAAAVLGGSEGAGRTADSLIAIGVAAAVPSALAGMADYSAIKRDAATTGLAHAALNSAALGLYLLSLGARAGGRRGAGVLLSTLALGATGVSGWLGAELIYRHRVGVSHAEEPGHAEGWIAVLNADELAIGESRRVQIGGDAVMLHRGPEGLYAIGAVCSHAGAPLEEGSVEGGCVECPWHQSVFDMRDGRVVHGPATVPQPRYDTRVANGLIEVRRPGAAQAPYDPGSGAGEGGNERAVGE